MNAHEMKETIRRVRESLRVTKVVATRSVKTSRGDFFAGFSSAWDTVQDDVSGPGADMGLSEPSAHGMSLRDARVAHYLVALQADIAAYEAAFANGSVSEKELEEIVKALKNNYSLLIKKAIQG